MARVRLVAAWAVLLFAASRCAAHAPRDRPAALARDRLTQEDFLGHGFSTVFEAIDALRSQWLRERGPDSFSKPGHVQVYLDDSRLGGVEALRDLPLTNVLFIRHVDGVEAAARWGLDHGNGVIVVATRP
jgi:hypothetical protein